MPEPVVLPDGWEQTLERSNFDSRMGREYTMVAFAHCLTGRKVIIHDVQEPNSFGGWDYLVQVTDPNFGELDLVEDLQTAREIAHEFMEEHPN